MIKVVLDTNIVVSGIISSRSFPRKILRLWQLRQIDLIISAEIIKEIIAVLNRPKIKRNYHLSKKGMREIKKSLERDCIVIKPRKKLKVIKDDSSDDKFINCASEGKAKYIISGDKHLLKLKKFKNIKIITPKEFIKLRKKSKTFKT